jgi:cation diffusion facilitator family transporter
LFTCAWIIYEATKRLSSGLTEIEVNIWSFLVIIVSIIIDFSRSRALMKVAKKYDSRALEADALHFSSDILSSAVVIVGLIGAYFHIHIADSLAALIVAIIVIYIAFKLGKKSIDDLLDKSPGIYSDQIMNIAIEIPEILKVHDLKIRTSGSQVLIELNIHVAANLSIEDAHEISHRYENKIRRQIKKSVVHVHAEPEIVHYK